MLLPRSCRRAWCCLVRTIGNTLTVRSHTNLYWRKKAGEKKATEHVSTQKLDEQRSISPSCTRYTHTMTGKLATDPGMLDPAIASSIAVHPAFSLMGQPKTDPTAVLALQMQVNTFDCILFLLRCFVWFWKVFDQMELAFVRT